MPSFIQKITVKCISQNDTTGKDNLHFYINNETEPFAKRKVSSGHSVFVDKSDNTFHAFWKGIYIKEDDIIIIKEYDIIDDDDIIFSHKISSSDIGTITYPISFDDTEYEITIEYL